MAEVSRRWSPYTYGKDNPIMFIDPDGMIDVSALRTSTNFRTLDDPFFKNDEDGEGWFANSIKENAKEVSDNPITNFFEKFANLFNGNGFVSDEKLLLDIQSSIIPYIEKYTESLINNGSPLTFEEIKKAADLLIQYHVLNAVINLDDAVAELTNSILENPFTTTGLVLICVGTGQFELLAVPTAISTYNTGQSLLNYSYGKENLQTVLLQTGGTVVGIFGPQGAMAGELINHISTITSKRNNK